MYCVYIYHRFNPDRNWSAAFFRVIYLAAMKGARARRFNGAY